MAMEQAYPFGHQTTLAQRLRVVRAIDDVSREVAAERCGEGFSARTWGRWESGPKPGELEKGPSVAQLRIIAREFDADFQWLVGGGVATDRYPLFIHPALPLVDGWDQLDEEQLEWMTRQSLTGTESGNGHAVSPAKRSAATAPYTDPSSHGSRVAA